MAAETGAVHDCSLARHPCRLACRLLEDEGDDDELGDQGDDDMDAGSDGEDSGLGSRRGSRGKQGALMRRQALNSAEWHHLLIAASALPRPASIETCKLEQSCCALHEAHLAQHQASVYYGTSEPNYNSQITICA